MANTNVEITCITKRGDHYDPHHRIEGVGGLQNGRRFWDSQEQVIRNIEADRIGYWVKVDGKAVRVIVALHNGHKYIKTEADSTTRNNLLALSECPR